MKSPKKKKRILLKRIGERFVYRPIVKRPIVVKRPAVAKKHPDIERYKGFIAGWTPAIIAKRREYWKKRQEAGDPRAKIYLGLLGVRRERVVKGERVVRQKLKRAFKRIRL